MGLGSDIFRLALGVERLLLELRERGDGPRSGPFSAPAAGQTPSAAAGIVVHERPEDTLSFDIGGTGIKGIVVNHVGEPKTARERLETPRPATPDAVLSVLVELEKRLGQVPYQRISAGFPGVVVQGTVHTAPNLHPSWAGFPLAETLEKRFGKATRVANDAGIQGLAVIEGRGVEMVITLGTGMGTGLYVDGVYVPNIELAHHPFKKGQTYEERVGEAARLEIGNKRWKKRVIEVIGVLGPIFNYRVLYIGGGNAKRLSDLALPEGVRLIDNLSGLLGGVRLWEKAAQSAQGSAANSPKSSV